MHHADSGLYYLQSRYYDPKIGRFLNADALVSTGQGVLGNNMFAYCLNSPIVLLDLTGNYARSINPNAYYYDGNLDGGGGAGIPFLLPGFFASIEDTADDVKLWVEAQTGIKEYRDNSVYVLKDPNDHYLVKYIGRTNDPARRQWEHNHDSMHPWRADYRMTVLATGLTKKEAMVFEQFLISSYTINYLENARREIAIKNIGKYQSYMYAITEIYTGIPGNSISEFISRR